jgi:predicted transcriptional regulator
MIVKYSIVDRMETKYIVAKEIKKVVDNNFKQVGIFTNQDVFESMDEMLSQLLNGENIELIK